MISTSSMAGASVISTPATEEAEIMDTSSMEGVEMEGTFFFFFFSFFLVILVVVVDWLWWLWWGGGWTGSGGVVAATSMVYEGREI